MTIQLRFLLLPGFSMLGFTCAIEPFRVANRFSPSAYQWQLVGADQHPVLASNGLSLNTDGGLGQHSPTSAERQRQLLVVVAGFNPLARYSSAIKRYLQRWSAGGAMLGGVDTGSFILAEAGLLDDYHATVHWESIAAFEERYPHVNVGQDLYTFDRQRMTCAGGTAALDMMLARIAADHDFGLAIQVSEQFVISNIRSREDHQRQCMRLRYAVSNPRLLGVLEDMERSCTTALDTSELAQRHALSVRQLERIFQHQLGTTPTLLHMKLRLERARRLVRTAALPMVEISIACGFASASYFSRSYRAQFGITPSQDRQHATATSATQPL